MSTRGLCKQTFRGQSTQDGERIATDYLVFWSGIFM